MPVNSPSISVTPAASSSWHRLALPFRVDALTTTYVGCSLAQALLIKAPRAPVPPYIRTLTMLIYGNADRLDKGRCSLFLSHRALLMLCSHSAVSPSRAVPGQTCIMRLITSCIPA